MRAWEYISQAGLAETTLRLGTHALLIALILLVAWGLREFYLFAQVIDIPGGNAFAAVMPTPTSNSIAVDLPPYNFADNIVNGVTRLAHLHTDVPSRARIEIVKYTVKQGDTLFDLAKKFGLKPETILWANQQVLADNPENLRPGQELNILPVDGTYYRWSAGDGLNRVAKFFQVNPEDIVNYPINHLSSDMIGDLAAPNIEPGTWLVIPGGRRNFVSWSAPIIPLDNPGVAKVLGPGACDSVPSGAIGSAAFIWPAKDHFLSGYNYSPEANHPAVDIAGKAGDPVYAADSGVVVYSGWNDWGYGNVIVINHGNGWQTLYAHLSAYYVNCGQSVIQGGVIGAIGATGNADGPHLHFELMYNGAKVNPLDYLH